MDKITIGKRIKYQREMMDLQQDEFGRAFNCSSYCIYSWESGRTTPDAITLNKIAHFCGKDINYFLDDDIDIEGNILENSSLINCQITQRELLILNKIRTCKPDVRMAHEILLGIPNKN